MVMFVVFLRFGFRSLLSLVFCFITMFVIICISLCCFTDAVEDPYSNQTYVSNLICIRTKSLVRVKLI